MKNSTIRTGQKYVKVIEHIILKGITYKVNLFYFNFNFFRITNLIFI